MEEPIKALRHWVEQQWPELTIGDVSAATAWKVEDQTAPDWQPLAGDAGGRRYFRLASEPPLLAVYAPVLTEKNAEFLKVARILHTGGVRAPEVASFDLEQGFFLIEDFGSSLFLEAVSSGNADALYRTAISTLLDIQHCAVDASILDIYDRAKLRDEMALFPEWFLRGLLQVEALADETLVLEQTFALLEGAALEQPQVLVHRDFHSRNLVVRGDGPLGVIDFQDAVIGPITYDLVSLLRDCYIQWPDEKVADWLDYYRQEAQQRFRPDEAYAELTSDTFNRWFDWMGLQRHIKVLGVFARLSLRDGKHGYLADLPLVMHYCMSVARRHPQLSAFSEWFETQVLPLAKLQSWWREFES